VNYSLKVTKTRVHVFINNKRLKTFIRYSAGSGGFSRLSTGYREARELVRILKRAAVLR
jgi:hypothetical protein